MKIYFYSNQRDSAETKAINSYLKKLGLEILGDESSQAAGSGENTLHKIDALVVEAKKLDAQAGYLIALSLSLGKDVLCLLPQGKEADEALLTLQKDKTLVKKLHLAYYQSTDLANVLSDFLESLDNADLNELFNIKYTLRVSRRINDYLNWKTGQVARPKADWLRDQIKGILDSDQGYQNYLKGKYRQDK